jgi:hypothetical protein
MLEGREQSHENLVAPPSAAASFSNPYYRCFLHALLQLVVFIRRLEAALPSSGLELEARVI